MIAIALKNLSARKLRTALTALAIVLGVAMVSGALTLTDTMKTAADELSAASYDRTDAVVTARTAFETSDEDQQGGATVSASLLERVRSAPDVDSAAGNIQDEAKVIGADGRTSGDGPYFGIGFDATVPRAGDLSPLRLTDGRWAATADEVVIDKGTAEREGYAVGDRIEISTRGPARDFEVVGTARFGEVDSIGTATVAVFDLEAAQELFRKEGRYDSILVAGDPGVVDADVRNGLARELPADVQVQTAQQQDRFTLGALEEFVGILRTILLAVGLVAVLVGGFTIFNTLSITIAQRVREFGMLRSLGSTRRQVLMSVVVEALVLGLGASVLGLLAGVGIAEGLSGLFAALGMELPQAGLVLSAGTAVIALAVGTLVTLVAGLVPAIRATRVDPVAVMREGSEVRRPRLVGRLVRRVASVIGRPSARFGGVPGSLARGNAMRNPGRTGATAGALVIGVALVTAVAVVGSGLRDSASSSLEDRISAQYVIGGENGFSPIDAEATRTASRVDGVRAASGVRQDEGRAFGDKVMVDGVDPATFGSVYRYNWKDGSDEALASLERGGAIVGEDFAADHELETGSRFEVESASGATLALRVAGIEAAPPLNALSRGEVTIAGSVFERAFDTERERYAFVSVEGGADVAAALRSALAAFPDAKVQTKQDYADEMLSEIDDIMSIFYVLLALAVIVSLLGIVNALALSVFERTREIGMLRAVGMTRRQVRRMVRHESVITTLVGAAIGSAVGLGIAGILSWLFADEGLAFSVPSGQLALFAVIAVGAGAVAAIGPARRSARMDVLHALQYE